MFIFASILLFHFFNIKCVAEKCYNVVEEPFAEQPFNADNYDYSIYGAKATMFAYEDIIGLVTVAYEDPDVVTGADERYFYFIGINMTLQNDDTFIIGNVDEENVIPLNGKKVGKAAQYSVSDADVSEWNGIYYLLYLEEENESGISHVTVRFCLHRAHLALASTTTPLNPKSWVKLGNLPFPDPNGDDKHVPVSIIWKLNQSNYSYLFFQNYKYDIEGVSNSDIDVSQSTSELIWTNSSTTALQKIGFGLGENAPGPSPLKLNSSGDYLFIYTATHTKESQYYASTFFAILEENNPREVIQSSALFDAGDNSLFVKGLIKNPIGCPENASKEIGSEFADNLECFIVVYDDVDSLIFLNIYVGWYDIPLTTTDLSEPSTSTATTTTSSQATTQLTTSQTTAQSMKLTPKKSHILMICFISTAIIFFLMATLAIYCHKRNKRRNRIVGIFMREKEIPNKEAKILAKTVDLFKFNSKQIAINYEEKIGSGSTATVYKGFLHGNSTFARNSEKSGYDVKFSNCNVAIKLPKEVNDNETGQILRELHAMRLIGYHSHITVLLGWCVLNDLPSLIFELAQQDLHTYVSSFSSIDNEGVTCMPLKEILSIAWQISVGMEYVASFKIIHRDLAARNILMFQGLHVKISDFGLCCMCDETFTYQATLGMKLPIRWLSLEALTEKQFSIKSDVWSFGILMYEIFTNGAIPYSSLSDVEIIGFLQSGLRLERPDNLMNDKIYDLILDCWKESVIERLSFGEITARLKIFLQEETQNYGYLEVNTEDQNHDVV